MKNYIIAIILIIAGALSLQAATLAELSITNEVYTAEEVLQILSGYSTTGEVAQVAADYQEGTNFLYGVTITKATYGYVDSAELDAINSSKDYADSIVGDHEGDFDHTLIETALQSESDPLFTSSDASAIDADDITNLSNLSGVNTGDQDLSEFSKKFETPYESSGDVINLTTNQLSYYINVTNDTTIVLPAVSNVTGCLNVVLRCPSDYDVTWSNCYQAGWYDSVSNSVENNIIALDGFKWTRSRISVREIE